MTGTRITVFDASGNKVDDISLFEVRAPDFDDKKCAVFIRKYIPVIRHGGYVLVESYEKVHLFSWIELYPDEYCDAETATTDDPQAVNWLLQHCQKCRMYV